MKRMAFHINSFMKGGIERVLIQQLKAFDRNEYKLTLLITYHFPRLEVLLKEVPADVEVIYLLDRRIYNATREVKAEHRLNPFVKIYDEFLQIPRALHIRQRLKELYPRFDVVVDFDLTLGRYISAFRGLKVGWFHFSVKNYHNRNARKLRRLGEKFSYYDKIVLISDDMRKEAQEMYPEVADKFVRIYNGVNHQAMVDKAMDTVGLSIQDKELLGRRFILSSGRLNEGQKDFSTLIKAYAKVAERLAQDLYIVGDGPHREELQSLANSLGMKNRIHFLGFKENPLPFVKAAEIFVLSSKFEGLPTVLLEALCFDKVVIAADCPTGPREILDNGRCGHLFPIGDVEALADLLLTRGKVNENELLRAQQEHFKKFHIGEVQKQFTLLFG